jgi:F-type H+-transporting ATPase subunit delta
MSQADSPSTDKQAAVGTQKIAAVYAKALLGAAQATGAAGATGPAGATGAAGSEPGRLPEGAASKRAAEVVEQLESLVADVLAPNPRLLAVFDSTLIDAEEKRRMLDRLLAGRATPLFLNFLKILAHKKRLGLIGPIASQARAIYDKMQGIVEVEVRSAGPIDAELSRHIAEQLRSITGGNPRLILREDPSLIAGVVLRVGDRVYDGSIATQLKRVRTEMIDRSVYEIQSGRDRFRHSGGD